VFTFMELFRGSQVTFKIPEGSWNTLEHPIGDVWIRSKLVLPIRAHDVVCCVKRNCSAHKTKMVLIPRTICST